MLDDFVFNKSFGTLFYKRGDFAFLAGRCFFTFANACFFNFWHDVIVVEAEWQTDFLHSICFRQLLRYSFRLVFLFLHWCWYNSFNDVILSGWSGRFRRVLNSRFSNQLSFSWVLIIRLLASYVAATFLFVLLQAKNSEHYFTLIRLSWTILHYIIWLLSLSLWYFWDDKKIRWEAVHDECYFDYLFPDSYYPLWSVFITDII